LLELGIAVHEFAFQPGSVDYQAFFTVVRWTILKFSPVIAAISFG
jgi:hypothetical protein